MKSKALSLLLTFIMSICASLVTVSPAEGQNSVNLISVTPLPDRAGLTARYQITFNTSATGALTAGIDAIQIAFPGETGIPSNLASGDVYVNGVSCHPNGDTSVSGNTLLIIPGTSVAASSQCNIVIRQSAGIANPRLSQETGDSAPDNLYTLTLSTDKDSADILSYEIFDWVGAYPLALAEHDPCTVWGAGFHPGATIHLNGLTGGPVHGSGIVGKDGTFEFIGYATGRNEANLIATDGSGRMASVMGDEPALGPNQPPIAGFNYLPPQPEIEETITFDASQSTDPDGEVISWNWDFGDGQRGTGKTTEHAYSLAGYYIVTLAVTDNRGTDSIISQKISLVEEAPIEINIAPIASAGHPINTEQESRAGAEVTLDGSRSYDPDGGPLTYEWIWDTGSASGMRPQVTMPPGRTEITLTVSDGEVTDTDLTSVTVSDTTPPQLSILSPENGRTYPSTHPAVPLEISMSDAVGIDSGFSIRLDGQDFTGEEIMPGEMTIGTHNITVIVRDIAGNTSRATTDFNIVAEIPPSEQAGPLRYLLSLLRLLFPLPCLR